MSFDRPILYVDDSPTNLAAFESDFSGRYDVRVVSSGAAALKLIRVANPAVILTDQRMPGMNGLELLRRVRRIRPDIVRIMVTVYDGPEPIVACLNEDLASKYIIAPWDRKELVKTIDWALAEGGGKSRSVLNARPRSNRAHTAALQTIDDGNRSLDLVRQNVEAMTSNLLLVK